MSNKVYPKAIYSKRVKMSSGLVCFFEVKPDNEGNGKFASITLAGIHVTKDQYGRNRTWNGFSKDDLKEMRLAIGNMLGHL